MGGDIFTFTRKIDWLPSIPSLGIYHGWGNGYVAIPETHKLYGIPYDNIDVDVHGGLTFGDYVEFTLPATGVERTFWVIGFDTNHYNDNLETCSEDMVTSETKRLFDQIISMKHESKVSNNQ